jgi:hypothetical protein
LAEELDHIRKRLLAEGDKTVAFFENLTDIDWNNKVYSSGSGWRIREILAHFISAERAYQGYLQEVLEGGLGASSDFDIDKFNETDVATMDGLPPSKLIDTYKSTREKTLRLTTIMEDSDLQKQAYHPWFEEKEVGWYLKLIYRHNTMHLQDVRKSLRTGEPVPDSDQHRTGRSIDP